MKFLKDTHLPDESIGDYVGHGRRNIVSERGVSVLHRRTRENISEEARRRISLAFRAPNNAFGATKLFGEAQMHERLQAAGIPVAHTTYRLDPTEHAVYCTDLTQGGKNFVLSDTNHTSQDAEWKQLIGEEKESAPNARQALDALASIAVQCASINAELMLADAFYFIVEKKTRNIRVTIGDYKHIVEGQLDPDLLLKNNLAVARQAAHARRDVFGLSGDEIEEWFDQKEHEIITAREAA